MKRWNWPILLAAPLLVAVAAWFARVASPTVRGADRLPLLATPVAVAVLSALAAVVLATRPRDPAAPFRWQLPAVGFVLQAAAFTIFLIRDQTLAYRLPGGDAEALRLLLELAFFGAQWLVFLGLAAFPATDEGQRARRRFLIDLSIIAASGVIVFWVAAQGHDAPSRLRPLAVSVAYVVLDLLVLFTLATHLLRLRPAHRYWPGLLVLAAGTTLLLLTDSWAAHQPAGVALRGGLAHERTVAGMVLVLGGLIYLAGLRGDPVAEAPTTTTTRPTPGLVSFGALTAGYALLGLVAFLAESPLVAGLAIGAAFLTFLAVLRQVAAARETLDLERTEVERAAENRFQSLVANASDAILVLSREGRVVYASPTTERLMGAPPDQLLGTGLAQLLHDDEADAARGFLDALLARPWGNETRTWRLRRADGAWGWAETTGTNLLDDPNVGGLVLTTRDVSERRELEQRLSHQAMHDALTGLPNRVLLRTDLEQVLRQAPRAGIGPTLLFLDLDGFKNVNDTLGHAQGDALLVAAATRLRDAVPGADLIARLGGDEFAALLAAPPDRQVVLDAAERVIAAFKLPFRVFGQEVPISASLGVAVAAPADTAGDVLRHADIAMYLAKANGRGRFEVFEQRMLEAVVGRLGLQADLRTALEADDRVQFSLDYQPIVELATGRPVGLEALLRWHHPQQGRVTPAVFIPLAEESGLIVPLGRMALELACQDAAQWVTDHPSIHVTVNLSARQIPDPGLVNQVATSLARSGLPPAALVLELTESAIMQQPERSASVLRELRALGVQLAIDDFGTGYSSLSYLQQLPATILKIDRSFLAALDGKDGRTLISGIVGLANGLSLATVGEGVETPEQAERLRALGCLCGQGLFFAPPLPAREVAAWLEERLGRNVGAV